jgi:hypothetical protein
MRMIRSCATLALLSALPFALSCSNAPLGEIVLAIRTDISIPKDVDKIVIDVTLAETGAVKYHMDYAALEPDHTFKLPATLAFTASEEDPGAAVRVRVLASRGDQNPRMIREVITTVPEDRAVTLPIAIEFLCDGTMRTVNDLAGKPIRDADGKLVFESICDPGSTCKAGKCVDATVPVATLALYDGATIFGGGTGSGDGDCFDAATCFDGATLAMVDMVDANTCRITAGNDVNVALLTQGAGMCGASGCFVPLDAESDSGWQPGPDGTLKLPPAVCDKLKSGAVTGVVTAPAGKSPCARKQDALPICGPFSSSGKYTPLDPSAPVVVASGQQNPVALTLAETTTESRVYWTTRGTFDENNNPKSDGTVKRAQTTGEQALEIASAQASPHDLALIRFPAPEPMLPEESVVFWSNALDGTIMAASTTTLSVTPLLDNLHQPEGIASDNTTLVWTELTSNQVSEALITFDEGKAAAGTPKPLDQASALGAGPHRVVAASGLRCWTYEDKLGTQGGVVACNDGKTSKAVATGLSTPRAIALVPGGAGQGTVYFASFADHTKGGGVFSVSTTGADLKILTKDGEDYPNGVAVDGNVVYWTSRTRGAVMRLEGGVLKEIAGHQNNPGAIAVGSNAIYWVNEGTADKPDGAIVRLLK